MFGIHHLVLGDGSERQRGGVNRRQEQGNEGCTRSSVREAEESRACCDGEEMMRMMLEWKFCRVTHLHDERTFAHSRVVSLEQ